MCPKTIFLKTALLVLLVASSSAFAQEQVITPQPANQSVGPNEAVAIDVVYSTANPVDETLTGLGLRIHWDSSKLDFERLTNVFSDSLLAQGGPEADSADFDGDPSTDLFINVAWLDAEGTWPGDGTTPVTLYSAEFTAAADFSGSTQVNFSASGTAAGRSLAASSAVINAVVAIPNITKLEGDNQVVVPGQALEPFVVTVTDGEGAPLAGVQVDWSLESGDGTLSPPSSTTDANGQASTILTPGAGDQFVVRATVAGTDQSVTFSAASSPLSGLPGLSDSQRATAQGLEQACAGISELVLEEQDLTAGEQQLRQRCDALLGSAVAGGSQQDLVNAISQITSDETSAAGTLATETINVQIDNLFGRLEMLRLNEDTGGFSVANLQLNLDGRHIPTGLFTGVLSQLQRGGGASADRTFGNLGVFISGNIDFGDKDGTGDEKGFDFDTKGITAGVDYRFSRQFVLGVAGGYTGTDTDFDAQGGRLDIEGGSVSVYGNYYPTDNLFIDGIANFGWNDYDSTRNIRFSIENPDTSAVDMVNAQAQADYDGTQYGFSLGGGYKFRRQGLTLTLLGRASYTETDIDDYRESGGQGLELAVEDQNVESLKTTLGGKVSYVVNTRVAVLVPEVRFEWEHQFEDDERAIQMRFINDPTRTMFSLPTDDPDRDYFRVGASVAAQFARGWAGFVRYQGTLGLEDLEEHNVTAGIGVEF